MWLLGCIFFIQTQTHAPLPQPKKQKIKPKKTKELATNELNVTTTWDHERVSRNIKGMCSNLFQKFHPKNVSVVKSHSTYVRRTWVLGVRHGYKTGYGSECLTRTSSNFRTQDHYPKFGYGYQVSLFYIRKSQFQVNLTRMFHLEMAMGRIWIECIDIQIRSN